MPLAILGFLFYASNSEEPVCDLPRLFEEVLVTAAVGLAEPMLTIEGEQFSVYLGGLAFEGGLEFAQSAVGTKGSIAGSVSTLDPLNSMAHASESASNVALGRSNALSSVGSSPSVHCFTRPTMSCA